MCAGAVVVTLYGLPWLAVGALPLAAVYWQLQRLYRPTSRQLKRLQSVTLSPVYTHFNDTLEGKLIIGLCTMLYLNSDATTHTRSPQLYLNVDYHKIDKSSSLEREYSTYRF